MPVLFGPVDFEPGQFAEMMPHLQTEAALLAREWFGTRPAVARSLGISLDHFERVLRNRHSFSPIPIERIVEADESEAGRAAAVRAMLAPRRAAAQVLAWLIRQPDGQTLLAELDIEKAVGLGCGAGRSAIQALQRQDLVERTPGWRNRKPGWRVAPAGRKAAVAAGLVSAGEASA